MAFRSAFAKMRQDRNISCPLGKEDAARLTEEVTSIHEGYEPLMPHFFARATRFLAEAKMMLYSAMALPIAVVVAGVRTGSWWPMNSWQGIGGGLLLFGLLLVASFARHRRRAVETPVRRVSVIEGGAE